MQRLSTVESEFLAICTGSQEVIYICQLLAELGYQQKNIVLKSDSSGAIAFAKNSLTLSRIKHIDIKWFYVREQLEKGLFSLKRVASKENISDILTKPLGALQHKYLVSKLLGVSVRGAVVGRL